jgi:PadR family transcriptional regulator, regulatory protein PadR
MEEKIPKELQTYTIKLLIFKLLKSEPSYGYKIIKDVEEITNGAITIEEGYLYPMLAKWKKAGFLDFEWEMTKQNQKRKKYHLTIQGVNQYYKAKDHMKAIDSLLAKF